MVASHPPQPIAGGLASWLQLTPEAAAERVWRAAGELSEAQRRAVVAHLAPRETLVERFAAADNGPLRGVPAFFKDVYPIDGYKRRAGSTFLDEEEKLGRQDGVLATVWRRAGGVVAGATHMHEFAYGITGENPHYGNVEHPFHGDRTSGGSSSGSAVAVARGLAPLAFGTDTAGSIRVPSAYCGLYSVRLAAAHRWLSDAFPLSPRFDAPGWFTATAADLANSLLALVPECLEPTAPSRLAWLDLPWVDAEVAQVQRKAALALGARPVAKEMAALLAAQWAEAPRVFRALRAPEAWRVHEPWFKRREQAYDPKVRARLLDGLAVTPVELAWAEAACLRLQQTFALLWQETDVLLVAATPSGALRHEDCTQAERDRIFSVTTVVSVAGLPAATLPLNLPSGLTTGLQAVVPGDGLGHWLPLLRQSSAN